MRKGYILVDFNQLIIANYMMYHKQFEEGKETDILRHMVLNAIKMVNNKFRDKYGDIILCCDGYSNWRRTIFTQYKANRKKARQESNANWDLLFDILGKLKEEFRNNMPYQVLQVDECEADDIIATICRVKEPEQKVLIFSSDKDFVQLQKYPNVDQYSPIKKEFVVNYDPISFTKTLIVQGDRSDGIPNVLSPDNTFVTDGLRQHKMTKDVLNSLVKINNVEDIQNVEIQENYKRNRQLIDLDYIPEHLQLNIEKAFVETTYPGREKILNYFTKHRLRELTENIQDF